MDKVKIYKDSYNLVIMLHRSMNEMPRKDRFSIGVRMTECGLDMLDYITLAYRSRDKMDRLEKLDDFFKSFTRLRTYLKLCLDLTLMSLDTLARLHQAIEGVHKQYNGWKKASSMQS